MSEPTDLGNLTAIGAAIGAFVSGIAATVGIRRRANNVANSSVRTEILLLHDAATAMKKDIEHMKKEREEDIAEQRRRDDQRESLISEIFTQLKDINETLTVVRTKVEIALDS